MPRALMGCFSAEFGGLLAPRAIPAPLHCALFDGALAPGLEGRLRFRDRGVPRTHPVSDEAGSASLESAYRDDRC